MPDIITLSPIGAEVARTLAASMPASRLHFHETVAEVRPAASFTRVAELVCALFSTTDGMVFIGPCGVMVRAVGPHLQSKFSDPPVVVVDVLARYAVSLLSGHEGGANDLCVRIANILGAEPVITTTSEAARTIIVGIGCRRHCAARAITEAVRWALHEAGATEKEVRFLATADIKAQEPGLIQAALDLGIPLRLIPSAQIRACRLEFTPTPLAKKKVNLPAVAEPSALLAGRRTALILPKMIRNGVTVALARENSL
ncbi:MAG: cobalamin biosynthesis protein [Desulfobacterales bacterium]|nr:cobalamin biosynthesis protein [Desulfobacterales bacterium]